MEKNKLLHSLRKETDHNKKEFTAKFKELAKDLEEIRYLKHKLMQDFKKIKQDNGMLYFYPIKVKE